MQGILNSYGLAWDRTFFSLNRNCTVSNVKGHSRTRGQNGFFYLQRISTARRPIAQASRNGDAPGREIVKIVHPLLDSEKI